MALFQRFSVVFLFCSLVVYPARAFSQLELTFENHPACPTQQQIRNRILDLVEGVSHADVGPVVFRVSYDPNETRWSLDILLTINQQETERRVSGDHCQEVTEAGAVIVAIAIDRLKLEEAQSSEGSAQGEADEDIEEDLSEVESLPPPSLTLDRTPRNSVAFSISTSADLEIGSLPTVGIGPALGFGIVIGRSRFDIGGSVFPGTEGVAEDHASAGAQFLLWFFELRGCFLSHFVQRRLEFGLCGGFEIGRIEAEAFGVTHPRRGSALWAGPTADLIGGIRIFRQLYIRFELGLFVPINRSDFYVEEVGTVHKISNVSGHFVTAIEVRLGRS